MKPEEYSTLSFEQKASKLLYKGEFIESVDYYNQCGNLYSLHSFFVEVYYNFFVKKIEKIEVAGPDELRKYLERKILGFPAD